MWRLPELLEGIAEEKARRTIIKLWAENESLKFKHPPPPPDNIPKELRIIEMKGGGNAELRQCMSIIDQAFMANKAR